MSHIYGMGKLHMAVLNLVGPGTMNSRLSNAINQHLRHIEIGADIPKEFTNEYSEIIEALSKSEPLTELEAEHYAQKIVFLQEKLAHMVH